MDQAHGKAGGKVCFERLYGIPLLCWQFYILNHLALCFYSFPVGGGYFVELEDEKGRATGRVIPANGSVKRMSDYSLVRDQQVSSSLQSRNPLVELRVISSTTAHGKSTQETNVSGSGGLTASRGGRYKDSDDDDQPAHLCMYEQYAMTAQPLSKLSPARRLSPTDEVFYPTVAVQALMRILKDTSLSNLHGMVMKVSK